MSTGDPPNSFWNPPPTYWPTPPAQQNYCPTCGRPWFGGWQWPQQPVVTCKTDTGVEVPYKQSPLKCFNYDDE